MPSRRLGTQLGAPVGTLLSGWAYGREGRQREDASSYRREHCVPATSQQPTASYAASWGEERTVQSTRMGWATEIRLPLELHGEGVVEGEGCKQHPGLASYRIVPYVLAVQY